MKALNFLFAVNNQSGGDRLFQNLKDKLVTEINRSEKCQVGRFDFVFDKDKLSEYILSGTYDIVLCSEKLGKENIGVGSIRSWSEEKPQVKVILLAGNERKGNLKLIQLVQKLQYTDVLFMGDLNGANVAALVTEGRSLEEAVKYYGIEGADEIKEMGILSAQVQAKEEETVVKEEKEDVSSNDSEETAAGSVIEEFIPEELEDAIEAFSDFEEFYEDEEEKKEDVVEAEDVVVPEMSFDFGKEEEVSKEENIEKREENTSFSFFDNSLADGSVSEEKVEEVIKVVPSEERVESVYSGAPHEEIKKEAESLAWQQACVEAETVPPSAVPMVGGFMAGAVKEEIIATRGYVTKVMDHDSILLEFDNEKDVAQLDMQAYRLLVRIKSGKRGAFENGRYRSSNVSLEAYVEYMVGRQTAMLAVMDFNCDTNRGVLENKECDVILTKMQ